MTADPLAAHLQVKTYNDLTLTDAVRPALGLPVRPRQGYRMGVYRDRSARLRLPMLAAAVSADRLFDTFLSLLDPLGDMVHVVLESSHGNVSDRHTDYRRNGIDAPILASYFCEFEDLLLNDGCTGVAVLSAAGKMEVQFDEHKQLYVYARDLTPFRRVLRSFGVRRRKELALLSDAEHLHHSSDAHAAAFEQLAMRMGVGDYGAVYSDESY